MKNLPDSSQCKCTDHISRSPGFNKGIEGVLTERWVSAVSWPFTETLRCSISLASETSLDIPSFDRLCFACAAGVENFSGIPLSSPQLTNMRSVFGCSILTWPRYLEKVFPNEIVNPLGYSKPNRYTRNLSYRMNSALRSR